MSSIPWSSSEDASPQTTPSQQPLRKPEPAIDVHDSKPRSYGSPSKLSWRPRVIRPWTLICFLIITLGLIAALEYIAHVLPARDSGSYHLTTDLVPRSPVAASDSLAQNQTMLLGQARIDYRSASASAANASTTSVETSRTASSAYLASKTPTSQTPASTSASTAYLASPSSQHIATSTTISIAYLGSAGTQTRTVSTTVSIQDNATSRTVGTAYLGFPGSQIGTSTSTAIAAATTVGAPAPGTYLHTDGPNPKDDDSSGSWQWNGTQVFIGTYLPVLIAVLYRMIWTSVYHAFCLLDPFQQLRSSRGSLGSSALGEFYQARKALTPLLALKRQRWALAAVALTQVLTTLLPGLAAESIHPDTNWGCSQPSDDTNNPCPPRISVNTPVIRVLQGVISLAALVLIIITTLATFRKQTGVARNPGSIAAVAALMHHPSLLAELQNLPADASKKQMMSAMEGRRYAARHWQDAFGDRHYGILPMQIYRESSQPKSEEPLMGQSAKPARQRSHWQKYGGEWILAIFTVGTLAVVLAYYLDGQDDGFNRFFSSNTFGPRLILTTAATVLATRWRSEEQKLMTMAPYQRLANGPAPARSTLYFQPHLTPLSSTFHAARHRYYLVASLTLITLLAEVLSVVISGVPFAPAEVWQQLIVSVGMSLSILGLMVIVVTMLALHRSSELELPRHPDTLGATMSYICGSRFVETVGEHEDDEGSGTSRNERLSKVYEFKKKVRVDGKMVWMVDECTEDSLLRGK